MRKWEWRCTFVDPFVCISACCSVHWALKVKYLSLLMYGMLYTLHVPKIISYLSVSHDNEKYISSMEELPPSTFSLSHSFKSTLKLVLYLSNREKQG